MPSLVLVYVPSFLNPFIFLISIVVFKIKIDGNSRGFHEASLNEDFFQFLNFSLQPIGMVSIFYFLFFLFFYFLKVEII